MLFVRAPGRFFWFIASVEPRPGLQFQVGPPRWERTRVAGLCLLAALHVFLYSAAFPCFNNVDEAQHFDTVVRYSHGDIPRRLETHSDEAMQYQALYGSKFYFGTNDGELMPPPWTWPDKQRAAWVAAKIPANPATNYEASQPPLYYACAGGSWWLSGKLCAAGHNRLYGLRFLNIPIVMLLVWLGWLAARQVYPDKPFRRLAVPAFIAIMPQSAFYSIGNDMFSALFFGLAFIGLLRFWRAEVPPRGLGIVTGLALAAAFLTKMTNLSPIITALVMFAFLALRHWQRDKLARSLPSFVALVVWAALPALAWVVWCKSNFGDFTGSQAKMDYWGWTAKPLLEWWHHPIFTPHGAAKFLNHFLPSFWQGELVWHVQPMSFTFANWIYTVVTIGLLLGPLARMTVHPRTVSVRQSGALWMSFFIFFSTGAFLVLVSIAFDFHGSPYPSRDYPYLTSGRQALAALIPFMLLIVTGLDNLMDRFREWMKYVILAALLLLMLGVEAASNWKAFGDPYNWFHM